SASSPACIAVGWLCSDTGSKTHGPNCSSVEEHQTENLTVAGSTPVKRSGLGNQSTKRLKSV
ncbi:MAG: hypothetical protein AAF394_16420, partial [Planctomycetota bacterium]